MRVIEWKTYKYIASSSYIFLSAAFAATYMLGADTPHIVCSYLLSVAAFVLVDATYIKYGDVETYFITPKLVCPDNLSAMILVLPTAMLLASIPTHSTCLLASALATLLKWLAVEEASIL